MFFAIKDSTSKLFSSLIQFWSSLKVFNAFLIYFEKSGFFNEDIFFSKRHLEIKECVVGYSLFSIVKIRKYLLFHRPHPGHAHDQHHHVLLHRRHGLASTEVGGDRTVSKMKVVESRNY